MQNRTEATDSPSFPSNCIYYCETIRKILYSAVHYNKYFILNISYIFIHEIYTYVPCAWIFATINFPRMHENVMSLQRMKIELLLVSLRGEVS